MKARVLAVTAVMAVRPAGIAALAVWLGLGVAAAQGAGPFGGFKHDSKAPIEIASDTLEVRQAEGKAMFAGEVVAAQGTLRLTADRLEVSYATGEGGGETGEIHDMRAEGNVFLSNGSETARGAWAEYDVAGGTMRMGGSVVLTQGANAIAGEALVINLDEGTGRIEGSGSGRVKSVFTPSGGGASQ
ncbi:MAG TPA: lipopolysaccharide transport periplasmic protein LptA [Thermohalobaculum sp.]|nr:lipopolysaccharide transport periplasmic protein LptA [Thermohalobaculum sp.]